MIIFHSYAKLPEDTKKLASAYPDHMVHLWVSLRQSKVAMQDSLCILEKNHCHVRLPDGIPYGDVPKSLETPIFSSIQIRFCIVNQCKPCILMQATLIFGTISTWTSRRAARHMQLYSKKPLVLWMRLLMQAAGMLQGARTLRSVLGAPSI